MQDTQDKVFRIDDPFEFLTKDLLQKEYLENKLTDKQIAQKYSIGSKVTVWRRRKFWGIENSCKNKSNKNATKNRAFSISKDDAIVYLGQGLTYVDIAEKMGCSRMVAYRRMKELGLIEDHEQEMHKLKWHEELDEKQRKFILGDLLGDGSITPRGMFQCSHSHKQLSYIQYKMELLKNLISPSFKLSYNRVKNYQNGKEYYSYYLRTMNNEFLKAIYDIYYIDKVKVFPFDYLLDSEFDEYSLAVWYMDDGSRNGNSATLHTYGFGLDGNIQMSRFILKKFGVLPEIKEWGKETRSIDKSSCLYFSASNSDKFFQLVAPHMLPHFQYKLPEKYRQAKETKA